MKSESELNSSSAERISRYLNPKERHEDEMNPGPYQANSSHIMEAGYRTTPHTSEGEQPAGSPLYSVLEMRTDKPGSAAVGAMETESTTGMAKSVAGADSSNRLTQELKQFAAVASALRASLMPAPDFQTRCEQAFDVANDLFSNAPTWVCFYRELMGGNGMLHMLFDNNKEFGAFLRTDQHHQIQLMLTALRSRDLPENDPNDPQRMITVRLPKSLHEAMCEEASRLNISVNRLCISRMLQLLDPEMIPETNSKPRGRKPRVRSKAAAESTHAADPQGRTARSGGAVE